MTHKERQALAERQLQQMRDRAEQLAAGGDLPGWRIADAEATGLSVMFSPGCKYVDVTSVVFAESVAVDEALRRGA